MTYCHHTCKCGWNQAKSISRTMWSFQNLFHLHLQKYRRQWPPFELSMPWGSFIFIKHISEKLHTLYIAIIYNKNLCTIGSVKTNSTPPGIELGPSLVEPYISVCCPLYHWNDKRADFYVAGMSLEYWSFWESCANCLILKNMYRMYVYVCMLRVAENVTCVFFPFLKD